MTKSELQLGKVLTGNGFLCDGRAECVGFMGNVFTTGTVENFTFICSSQSWKHLGNFYILFAQAA